MIVSIHSEKKFNLTQVSMSSAKARVEEVVDDVPASSAMVPKKPPGSFEQKQKTQKISQDNKDSDEYWRQFAERIDSQRQLVKLLDDQESKKGKRRAPRATPATAAKAAPAPKKRAGAKKRKMAEIAAAPPSSPPPEGTNT